MAQRICTFQPRLLATPSVSTSMRTKVEHLGGPGQALSPVLAGYLTTLAPVPALCAFGRPRPSSLRAAMDEIKEFSDERNKAWCVHCGWPLASLKASRDHVPTKTLLRPPYPANLPIVMVCHDCNQGFAKDEQYLVAFLSAVLAGTTDPPRRSNSNAARILQHNTELRAAIDASRQEYRDDWWQLRTLSGMLI